jgi:hypothetical protein
MAHASSQGEIRPNLTLVDLHFLNRALVSADAVASLIEGAIRYPESVTPARLAILAAGLRHAADTIDPSLTRTVGGLRHG